jgi:hypothetical protein
VLARAGRVVAIVFLLWLAGLALAGLGILPAGDLPLGPVLVQQSPPPLRAGVNLAQPSRADLLPARAAALTASASLRGASHRGGSLAASTGSRPQPPTLTAARGALGSHRGSRLPGSRSSGSGHGSPPAAVTTPGGTTASPGGMTATAGGAAPPGGTSVGTSTTPSTATGTGKTAGRATITAPGQTHRQSTPGHTSATAPGNSVATPGQVKQTTTTTTITTTTNSPGQSGSAPGQTVTHGSGHGNNG